MAKAKTVKIAVDCTPVRGGYTVRWKVGHNPSDSKPKRYPWNYITEGPAYHGKLKILKSKKLAKEASVAQAVIMAEYGFDALHPALTHED